MAINKKNHALHNKSVCELINSTGNGKMNDWVVTTAFYSALHFVHHEIFPLPGHKRLFQDFETYYNCEYPDQDVPKHSVTKHLVSDHFSAVSDKYNWLFKECFNARYRNYNVHAEVAQKAIEYLSIIEENTGD